LAFYYLDVSIRCLKLRYIFDPLEREYIRAIGGYDDHREASLVTEVPRVREWNMGLGLDNFVRVTIQRACYVKNDQERWNVGFPHVIIIYKN
jgi:hypothetical protein